MVDALEGSINSAVQDIEWDKPIDKNTIVEPSPFIEGIHTTVFSMLKVLLQVVQMPPSVIEVNVFEPALFEIISRLKTLYLDKLSLSTSKYAKKRIKVDIKSLINNCFKG